MQQKCIIAGAICLRFYSLILMYALTAQGLNCVYESFAQGKQVYHVFTVPILVSFVKLRVLCNVRSEGCFVGCAGFIHISTYDSV